MAPASFASANLRVILLLAKGRADFLLILSKTKVVEGEGLGKRDISVSLAICLSRTNMVVGQLRKCAGEFVLIAKKRTARCSQRVSREFILIARPME